MPSRKFKQELMDIISSTELESKKQEKSVEDSKENETSDAEHNSEFAQEIASITVGQAAILQSPPIRNTEQDLKTKSEIYSDIHKGRRERVRQSVDKDPEFESFADHEVLEYILFDTIARVDTNPYAHELINHFGSLWGVLNASANELLKFPYISEKTARRIRDYIPIARRAEISRLKNNVFLDTTIRAVKYLQAHFAYKNKELIFAACLDVNDRLLSVCKISEGDTSLVPLSVKRIAEAAFASGASKIILSHNHPAETLAPSKDDIESTKRICVALLSMNILLVDHIIFTSNNYFSFFVNGIMEEVYKNCDKAIGSDVCRQLRIRKYGSPENYVLESESFNYINFTATVNEPSVKYFRWNPEKVFSKKT